MDARTRELIEAADLNGLLRVVDGLCSGRAWEELLELADASEDALERGKQLWPIAAHIDYRIALEAPAGYAAEVLGSGLTRFMPGPLTEVAASTHPWAELAPHIDTPQIAAYVAQERVLRGEVLDGDERAHPEVLELPLHLEPWEPTYSLARFASDHVEVQEPWEPRTPMRTAGVRSALETSDPHVVEALLDLVQPWTAESNGAARAVVVDGDAVGAASALTYGTLSIGPLAPEEALQRMAWAAAAGGAHGRRRGAALGRSMAWYTAALIVDLPWPCSSDELGDAIRTVNWFRWDEGAVEEGWVLRLAVEDPSTSWAAAIAATDLLENGAASAD